MLVILDHPRSASRGTAGAMPSIHLAGAPVVGVTMTDCTPTAAYAAMSRTNSSRVSGVGRELTGWMVLRIWS